MKILGIMSAFSHLCLFTYIYISSMGYLTMDDFTLSSAFQYSEKIGSSFLIIITTILLLKFLKEEGHFKGSLKYLFLLVFFIWFLFLNEHKYHKFFAFLVLLTIMSIPHIICSNCLSYELKKTANLCSYSIIISGLFSLCENLSDNGEYFKFLFSCMEIIVFLSHFLFLIEMSRL